jgi:hypothetical protein
MLELLERDHKLGAIMSAKVRTHFWIEFVLALLSAAALAMTLVWPQWIEIIFGLQPDAGDGSGEWGVTVGLTATTVVLAALASRSWRKSSAA